MPGAVPGVGECKICFEIVPSVKVLDCGHSLCLPCASKIVDGQKKAQDQRQGQSSANGTASTSATHLVCPECRAVTECGPQGARSLKTRYFGLLKCDLCLEKKDADDCWWCGECVRAICSKCSIKEHSKLNHTISEWNKLEPVKYSVNYVSQIRVARQGSTEAEHNRKAVDDFLSAVEQALHAELSAQPELDRLQNDLFERYGNRFKHQPLSAFRRGSNSSPNLLSNGKSASSRSVGEEGARVVAKVLQLAGSNILENVIPSMGDQKFQLRFTVTPEEVARLLRSKVEFVPLEQELGSCKLRVPGAPAITSGNGTPYRHSYHNMDRIREEEAGPSSSTASVDGAPTAIAEEIFLSNSTPGRGEIVEVDYDGQNFVALRHATSEVCVVNLLTRKTLSTVPIQMKHECRSLCFSETVGVLYLALQSTAKRHEWMLEAIDLSKSPICVLFATPFDIDPEDRVINLHLSIGPRNKDTGVVYEVRVCERNVSEIWRAVIDKKSKTPSKVKLKETMIYQKDESHFTHVLAVQSPPTSKEYVLFVWDDHSRALYRLIVRDKRCHSSTKIINAPTCVPCSLDSSNRLWFIDSCTGYACVSAGPALNKAQISFKEIYRLPRNSINRLWADVPTAGADFVFVVCVSLDSKSLKTIKFLEADITGEADGYSPVGSRAAASIKKRSFSARV